MRFRNPPGKRTADRSQSMTTMIDVVFLLLVFFMLTLKIIAPEGEFSIRMPAESPAIVDVSHVPPAEIRIRLVANNDGTLHRLQLGRRDLGNDDRAFERLGHELFGLIGRPNAWNKDVEIEIDSDYHLNYEHVMQAIGVASGRLNPKTGRMVRYETPIKFAPARRNGA